MQGLKLFSKTNSKRHWNLASYHPPQSLTWTWILSLSVLSQEEGKWFYFSPIRTNVGLQWILTLHRVRLQWHRQRPMWYRDIWQRERERRDRDSYERYLMRSEESRPEVSEGPRTLQ
jgi:hypothetical protein